MKLPPVAFGVVAGLGAMLLLAPASGTALGKLATARADRARLAALASGPALQPAPLVAPARATGNDLALAADRIRERAHNAGVLVEELGATARGGALITLKFSFSGTEKAVVGLADGLERDPMLMRFADWRIEPIQDGVRLTGHALAVRQ